jgi:hypothetical protein
MQTPLGRLAPLFLLSAVLLLPRQLEAQAPFQLSFFPGAQLVSEDQSISGVRLGLVGRNVNVEGLDLGLVTLTTGRFTGLQVAAANIVQGDMTGVQLGWGLGASLANIVRGRMEGAQLGLYNETAAGQGLQWGLVNNAVGRMEGLQISFVNLANDFHGIQLGLINIIRSKSSLSVLPIVNWKFDD